VRHGIQELEGKRMELHNGALYGALEQLAHDRRAALLASARPRQVAADEADRRRAGGWLIRAIGLRPAAATAGLDGKLCNT
jgi:hypothetical protein